MWKCKEWWNIQLTTRGIRSLWIEVNDDAIENNDNDYIRPKQ